MTTEENIRQRSFSATASDDGGLACMRFEALIREVFHRHGLPVERWSDLLFSQLAYMPLYRGLNYPFQFVEREVSHLEGLQPSKTKAAEPFSDKGPLRGFMHKHFYVPGYEHLGINARLAWKLDNPNSGKLQQLIRQISENTKHGMTKLRFRNSVLSWLVSSFMEQTGSSPDCRARPRAIGSSIYPISARIIISA